MAASEAAPNACTRASRMNGDTTNASAPRRSGFGPRSGRQPLGRPARLGARVRVVVPVDDELLEPALEVLDLLLVKLGLLDVNLALQRLDGLGEAWKSYMSD